MLQSDTPITRAKKLRGLRQIEAALCREKHPTLLACGLSLEVACSLADGGLINVWIVSDQGSELEKYRLESISSAGLGMLAENDVAEPEPLRVSLEPRHESVWVKLRRALVSGIWDVVKILLGIPVGIAVGYFLWKFHWK
jgi:hypothetical protein